MAPSYIASAVTVIAMILALFNIQVGPENLQVTVTTLLAIGTPLFVMIRQLWTGRSTLLGTRPKE